MKPKPFHDLEQGFAWAGVILSLTLGTGGCTYMTRLGEAEVNRSHQQPECRHEQRWLISHEGEQMFPPYDYVALSACTNCGKVLLVK